VTLTGRLEADPVPNLELQHLHMSTHLAEKTQALDDAVVEINQLGLGELVLAFVLITTTLYPDLFGASLLRALS
jgi:hypothetical protein